jgi:hypothetical protein
LLELHFAISQIFLLMCIARIFGAQSVHSGAIVAANGRAYYQLSVIAPHISSQFSPRPQLAGVN